MYHAGFAVRRGLAVRPRVSRDDCLEVVVFIVQLEMEKIEYEKEQVGFCTVNLLRRNARDLCPSTCTSGLDRL